MKIEVNIDINGDEAKQLAGILKSSVSALNVALSPYASAAAQEYVGMILGQKVFTRGSDIMEYRLFLLIQTAFGNKLPDEQRVCDLFQCTLSQSRSLLRSVMSKYQYELSGAIGTTLKALISGAARDDDVNGVTFIVNNENLVEALNRALAGLDGSLSQVEKMRGTVSTYSLKRASYESLCTNYGITPIKFEQ